MTMMIAVVGISQDIHFSQYYASPMTLNPGLTGKFDGNYRINAIYRGQYFGLSQSASNYRTPSISVDFSLLKDKMKGNALGVGLAFVNDQQSASFKDPNDGMVKSGKLNTNTILVSLAYTLNLGKKRATQISLGLQPSYTIRSVDGSNYYPDAFSQTDLKYQSGSAADEKITEPTKKYFNFSYGLFFNTNPIDWLTFYIGYSMKNVTQPQTAIIKTDASSGNLPFLHVVHGGFEFELGRAKKFVLIPGFLYQNLAKANEANAGLTLGYNFLNKVKDGRREKGTVFVGLWNRLGNDVNTSFQYRNITPKVGVEYKSIRLSAAYDIDVSNFSNDTKQIAGSNRPMAYEIAISYIGNWGKKLTDNKWLFNPRY